jgi:menaquinone-9 beta-reductase
VEEGRSSRIAIVTAIAFRLWKHGVCQNFPVGRTMPSKIAYDIITVGGGLAGATLAKAMAENGARVLVLERETRFKDRVRGEGFFPWGIAELRDLGIDHGVTSAFAREVPYFDIYLGGERISHRDLKSSSKQKLPALNWVHHEMEEVLLQCAEKVGAEVRKSTSACGLQPATIPSVLVERDGRIEELRCRLLVCADGRGSVARKWAGFEVQQDSYGMLMAGVLLNAMPSLASEANHWMMNPGRQFAFLAPQLDGRIRAYAGYLKERGDRLQGAGDLQRFIEESTRAGGSPEWYAGVKSIGPLATFDGTDTWVDHPYKRGVALIGDAAASNDPCNGQGQGLALRDARVLRDQLLASEDWDAAAHAYAEEHDRYYGALHKMTGWIYELFHRSGPEAEALRARAFPLLAEDLGRMPDVLMSGPEEPLDENARRRFFGEE